MATNSLKPAENLGQRKQSRRDFVLLLSVDIKHFLPSVCEMMVGGGGGVEWTRHFLRVKIKAWMT